MFKNIFRCKVILPNKFCIVHSYGAVKHYYQTNYRNIIKKTSLKWNDKIAKMRMYKDILATINIWQFYKV